MRERLNPLVLYFVLQDDTFNGCCGNGSIRRVGSRQLYGYTGALVLIIPLEDKDVTLTGSHACTKDRILLLRLRNAGCDQRTSLIDLTQDDVGRVPGLRMETLTLNASSLLFIVKRRTFFQPDSVTSHLLFCTYYDTLHEGYC